jgi:hypothetical protein
MASESDLYAPVKAFLERQGYAVKAEIDGSDVVAKRGGEPPIVVETWPGWCCGSPPTIATW